MNREPFYLNKRSGLISAGADPVAGAPIPFARSQSPQQQQQSAAPRHAVIKQTTRKFFATPVYPPIPSIALIKSSMQEYISSRRQSTGLTCLMNNSCATWRHNNFEIMHAGIWVLISHFSFPHTGRRRSRTFIMWRGHRFSYSTSRKLRCMSLSKVGLDRVSRQPPRVQRSTTIQISWPHLVWSEHSPPRCFFANRRAPINFVEEQLVTGCHVWSGTHNFSSVAFVIWICNFCPQKIAQYEFNFTITIFYCSKLLKSSIS